MTKTFIAFFILLIFCGAVFFIGWTQLRVEPDSCGIVVSKLNGASEKPIQPGEFYWNWEFLLPTNAQLITFKVTPANLTKTTSGSLPSGQIYSSIYSSPNNFDYSFTISMTLSVSAEQIASMYKAGKISDNTTLTEYLNTCGDTISQLVANFYLKKLKDNPYLPIESYRRDEIVNSIREEESGVNIYIGSENNFDDDVTIIKSKYVVNGEEGTIALIGPKRMDYDRVITLLNYINDNINK